MGYSFALACLSVLASPAAATVPTITDLGVVPGGQYSYGTGVSSDGSVVTGYSGVNPSLDFRAFRWTEATGMQPLAGLSDCTISQGWAVSGDGQSIVGSLRLQSDCSQQRASLWNGAGVLDLGVLQDRLGSEALGVSTDGSVVVGYSQTFIYPRATRWTIGGGMLDLGVLPGPVPNPVSIARSVSGDGQVIVGMASGLDGLEHAFRWTSADGMEDLGLGPPGYPNATPMKVSADGTTLVGVGRSISVPLYHRAFRWTRTTGMTGIPTPSGEDSLAYGVNGDGTAVVGGTSRSGGFLWTPSLGTVRLFTYVRDQGADMSGWDELYPYDISPDGSSITGWGSTPHGDRAFVIRGLRLPCRVDFNGDGLVDFADYLEFLNLYDAEDPRVDFNMDGLVDFSDYLEFLNHYDAGC